MKSSIIGDGNVGQALARGFIAAVKRDNFAAFAHPNGSLFEIYGPGDVGVPAPWQAQGAAFGFAADDLAAVTAKAEAAGVTPLDTVRVPGLGTDGGIMSFAFFEGRTGAPTQCPQPPGTAQATLRASEPPWERGSLPLRPQRP